jgi:hypothetical protein
VQPGYVFSDEERNPGIDHQCAVTIQDERNDPMSHERHVYELDTDALMATLQTMLRRNGIDVREQIPAGVWWLHSDQPRDAIRRELTDIFGQIVSGSLREIEQ